MGTIEKLPRISDARLPINYQDAKKALAACAKMDECQDWAKKAEAMASYARQANDDSLRKMADRIQARAIRRLGQLLIKSASKQVRYADFQSAWCAYSEHALSTDVCRPPLLPGVYGAWIGEECMYIGESRSLRKRLGSHERKHMFKVCDVRWLVCLNHKQVEKWFIENLRPPHNGITLDRIIMRYCREQMHERVDIETRWSDLWDDLFGDRPISA